MYRTVLAHGILIFLLGGRRLAAAGLSFVVLLSLSGCLKTSASSSSSDTSTLSSCSLDTATTSNCQVATAGTIVTRTTGSNITSWSNGSASTSVTATIPNGYYTGKTISFTSANLLAANIRYGVSIFGVTGTDPGVSSNACRDRTTTQISANEETSTYAGATLPTGYREVPVIASDDEGTNGTNVTYVDRSAGGWVSGTCGTSGSIETRITDCVATFSADATWDGASKGNAGQASWSLVTRQCYTGVCREVWRDNRTKLLWSSKVGSALNWCKAAGNAEAATPTCAGNTVSACYEGGGLTNADAAITAVSGRPIGLAELNASSTPAVRWRVPTVADYKQADIDGIRFVLPDMGTNASATSNEWSATSVSTVTTSSWVYDAKLGGTSALSRDSTSANVRCVGR